MIYRHVKELGPNVYLVRGGGGLSAWEHRLLNIHTGKSITLQGSVLSKKDIFKNKYILHKTHGSVGIINPRTLEITDITEAYLEKSGLLKGRIGIKLGVKTITGETVIPATAKQIQEVSDTKFAIQQSDGSGIFVVDIKNKESVKLSDISELYSIAEMCGNYLALDMRDHNERPWGSPLSLFAADGRRLTRGVFLGAEGIEELGVTAIIYTSDHHPEDGSSYYLVSDSGELLGDCMKFFSHIVYGTGLILGKTSPYYKDMPSTWWKLRKTVLIPIEAMPNINEKAILSSAQKVYINPTGGYHG